MSVLLIGVNMTPNDDHEAREANANVSDEVKHELGLGVVLLKVCQVGEEEGQQQVAAGDGDGGCVLLEVAFGRGDGTIQI